VTQTIYSWIYKQNWICELDKAEVLSTFSPMFSGSLSPQNGASSGYGWRSRPTDVEGSCEYIDSRKEVFLHLCGWAGE